MSGRLQRGIVAIGRWFGGLDLLVMVAVLAAVLAAWTFTIVAGEVIDGSTEQFDNHIIKALRDPADPAKPIGPEWMAEIGRDLTAIGGIAMISLVTVAVTGFLLLRRKYHAALFVLVAIGGGLLASSLLKDFYDRPRPSLVPHLSQVMTSSFPSGHSLMSAVVYLTLGSLLARLTDSVVLKLYYIGIALLLTFLVGASRVYMGVHFPTDVLAGWAAGLSWSVCCWLCAQYLQRRGQVEPPE